MNNIQDELIIGTLKSRKLDKTGALVIEFFCEDKQTIFATYENLLQDKTWEGNLVIGNQYQLRVPYVLEATCIILPISDIVKDVTSNPPTKVL